MLLNKETEPILMDYEYPLLETLTLQLHQRCFFRIIQTKKNGFNVKFSKMTRGNRRIHKVM